MTQPESRCYYLPAEAADRLATGPLGKLTLALTEDEATAPFTVLDCFDQALRHSGRLLLATGSTFLLLTADGRMLTQLAKRKGQFVADFPEGPVKQALADLSPLRSLLVVGSGQLRRALLTLLDDDQKTQCRAYLHVLTETGGKAVVLVTLQALIGYDKALAALHGHVMACGGIALSNGGLYAEIFPGHIAYEVKPEVIIAADDTAFAAATDIISAYIPVARANEGGIIADHDTEFLHDYRIALRKIRSVLSLFKGVFRDGQTEDLKARFSALMVPTGRLRDLDVYLLEKRQYYDLLPKTLHGGLDKMFSLFADERKAEKTRLARHLRTSSYLQEIADLRRLFDKRKRLEPGPNADLGAHDYACALIWKRYRKICKIAAEISPETEDAEIHVLRIHCKKLRYLMEFFGPLFPKEAFSSLLKPLKRLQDNLGLVNDLSVQQVSLLAFLRRVSTGPAGVDLEIAQSVGALIAVLHRRQREERVKIGASFDGFNSPQTQDSFRDLFHHRGGRH